ncbi:MAG TPA: hypothetical protein PKM11_06595 [Methanomassiliicoccales archaeon]|nr:hypothetical protein [Methanomassiliicoccales archaeon]
MRDDRRGIEGLPLRLVLVALLISLTLPTMISVMNQTTSDIAGEKAAEIAKGIAATIEEMSAGGPGNVRMVNVPNDLLPGVSFTMGGESDSADCQRIRWNVNGRQGDRYLVGAIIVTDDGKPILLTAGDSIRLECQTGAWGTIKAVKI